jgi:light-regulated signal transduction histidine kinase (bacteriophytochrome)
MEARRRLDAARGDAQRAAEAAAAKLEEHNRGLRRTQRAMLNVIEDLRDAREALATKVEDRTRELAATNRQLESKNRELEEFVYIASHDLQEPLRTVAGYLQMIQRRYGERLGVEADEFIRFAIEGAQRMQALIESLLLYARVTTTERTFEPTSLDEVLDAVIQNLALRIEETGATIERAPLPTLRVDRTQMIQLFQNLLSNALKFAGPRPPHVHVASRLAAGVWTITVRDEGLGFNPRFADRIFKVFRRLRRDTPGTGIGLAVCKKIVEHHGGTIEADAAPGAGSTFSVHLPEGPLLGASDS